MVLTGDTEFSINGKQKGSVREETNAVSGTAVMSVQNQHKKPTHPLSHQHKGVKVRRQDFLTGIRTELLCDSWHPPECQFCKSESGCKVGNMCSHAHRQVDEQPRKADEGW